MYIYPKLIRGKTNQGIYDDTGLVTNDSCYISVLYHSLKEVNNKSITNSIKKWSEKSRKELESISKNFDLKYIQAIMNSNLCKYYLNTIRTHRIKYYTSSNELKLMPIKNLDLEKQHEIASYVDDISYANIKLFNEINSFHKWLLRNYDISKLSNKLENYYEMNFEDFLKEINKKIKIPRRKQQELLENEFKESLATIKPLQNKIQELETEINQLVYSLYDLTSEDIAIIENSFQE